MIQKEVRAYGADLNLVDGLISDAGKLAKEMGQKHGWFDVSTLKEPYRAEGKKTMGLELAEDFNWILPDVIIYPTGGGTGIVGMSKAFDELEQLGFIGSERPRFVSVQSSGCAPVVKAFNAGKRQVEFWNDAKTLAPGLRVPTAFADYLILDALYSTNGTALSVHDDEIATAMREVAKIEGIFLAPEAAATYAAWKHLSDDGWVDANEQVVLFDTATGFTTPHLWN
jgi:threonine synthase